MAAFEVPDELWARITEVLPVRQRRHRWPGRKPLDDRACLNGILFVLLTRINWGDLPQQLGYGSGMTCWRGALADLFDVTRGSIRNAIDDVLPLLAEDGFQLPPLARAASQQGGDAHLHHRPRHRIGRQQTTSLNLHKPGGAATRWPERPAGPATALHRSPRRTRKVRSAAVIPHSSGRRAARCEHGHLPVAYRRDRPAGFDLALARRSLAEATPRGGGRGGESRSCVLTRGSHSGTVSKREAN
jgi:transposase